MRNKPSGGADPARHARAREPGAGRSDVGARSVRLAAAIRRIGTYPVPIQFDKDLRTEITVVVEPDQPLEERDEMEFDDEGNLIIKEVEAAAETPEESSEGGQPSEDDAGTESAETTEAD